MHRTTFAAPTASAHAAYTTSRNGILLFSCIRQEVSDSGPKRPDNVSRQYIHKNLNAEPVIRFSADC